MKEGGNIMAKLSESALKEQLQQLTGWQLSGNVITKKFTWPSFKEAITFVNKVADLAEAADHHPDFTINYRNVTLTLSTHSEGGITENDTRLAGQIERL